MDIEIDAKINKIGWIIRAKHDDLCVGQASLIVINEKRLKLTDIIVYDKVENKSAFARFLGRKTKNYRNMGIGTTLIEFIIEKAHEYGYGTIFASITFQDIIDTPHLLDWYRHRGFEVNETNAEHVMQNIVANIEMKL